MNLLCVHLKEMERNNIINALQMENILVTRSPFKMNGKNVYNNLIT
jgi:hypothetical protein